MANEQDARQQTLRSRVHGRSPYRQSRLQLAAFKRSSRTLQKRRHLLRKYRRYNRQLDRQAHAALCPVEHYEAAELLADRVAGSRQRRRLAYLVNRKSRRLGRRRSHLKSNGEQAPQDLGRGLGAQFQLECPNKESFRIWATHNFPGSSIWNTLHGPQRAAHTKAEADVYVCGHFHNWGHHQEESASRRFTCWLARARGYKWNDDHAHVLGHEPQQEGATILAVFDPNSENQSSRVTCWADPFAGADYLEFLRAKHAKEGEKKS